MGEHIITPCPFEAALAPDALRFSHENDSPRAVAGRAVNRAELSLAQLCHADGEADIRDHTACTRADVARSATECRTLLHIALVLARLPQLAGVLHGRAHLPPKHLRTLAEAVLPVEPTHWAALELGILDLITPTVDKEAFPGVRVFHRALQILIASLQPEARPIDVEGAMKDEVVEKVRISRSRSVAGGTTITATLTDAHAKELTGILDATCALQDCDRARALMSLGSAVGDVQVCLNLYRSIDGGPGWMPGVGWLSEVATEEYMEKVTSVRFVDASNVDGYSPSDNQTAYTVGRDGTCMFPHCDRPADICDKDHVLNYSDGGPTDTDNLHNVCRHHHNLKTQGLWDVTRSLDGTSYWTSRSSGAQVATKPSGPIRHPGSVRVDSSLRRRAQVLAEHNEKRMKVRAAMSHLVARATAAQPLVRLLREARIMGSEETIDEFITSVAEDIACEAAKEMSENYSARAAKESLRGNRPAELRPNDLVVEMIGVYLGHPDPLQALRNLGTDLADWLDHVEGMTPSAEGDSFGD